MHTTANIYIGIWYYTEKVSFVYTLLFYQIEP